MQELELEQRKYLFEDLGLDRLLESLKKSKASGKSSSIVVIAEE
jgi:hypothetical protein